MCSEAYLHQEVFKIKMIFLKKKSWEYWKGSWIPHFLFQCNFLKSGFKKLNFKRMTTFLVPKSPFIFQKHQNFHIFSFRNIFWHSLIAQFNNLNFFLIKIDERLKTICIIEWRRKNSRGLLQPIFLNYVNLFLNFIFLTSEKTWQVVNYPFLLLKLWVKKST